MPLGDRTSPSCRVCASTLRPARRSPRNWRRAPRYRRNGPRVGRKPISRQARWRRRQASYPSVSPDRSRSFSRGGQPGASTVLMSVFVVSGTSGSNLLSSSGESDELASPSRGLHSSLIHNKKTRVGLPVRIPLPPAESQVRTCLSRQFAFLRREAAVSRGCAGWGERRGRQRRARSSNIALRSGSVSVRRYSSTALSPMRFATVGAPSPSVVGPLGLQQYR